MVIGVLLILAVVIFSVFWIPVEAVERLVKGDPLLQKALALGSGPSSCPGTVASRIGPEGKDELTTLADFWLKLRNSAEQRADWFYVALIAGLAAVMSGYDKLQKALTTGRILLLTLGIGGLFAGFWIAHATLYDVGRINLV